MKAWKYLLIFGFVLLAACSQAAEPTPAVVEEVANGEATAVLATDVLATDVLATEPPPAAAAVVETAVPVEEVAPAVEPTAVPLEEPAAPIEVTYYTPAQQEGPYYPVEKLTDRDNDLTVLAGATGTPAGTPLDFSGVVYDATGTPLQNILIEIWQTDSSGAYMHPNDPATDGRDLNFQFYGEATTDENGRYQFRTILPGKYEPRPVHIHVKVKADGQELLTTQFYFAGDPGLEAEGLTGGDSVHLIMDITETADSAGNPRLVGVRDIVLAAELPAYHVAAEATEAVLSLCCQRS